MTTIAKIAQGAALGLLLAVIILAGCATRGEIQRFQSQVDSLSVVNRMQSRQIERLDSLIQDNARLLRTIRAEHNSNMTVLQEEMRIVESIMRDYGFQVSSMGDRIESLKEDISRSETESDTSDSSAAEPENGARGEEIYSTAVMDMNKGNYDLAIMGFESYLEDFPEGPRADDARYNIGESLLAKGEYSEAALSFLTVTRKWPESQLTPPSLYKAGRAYEELEQSNMAKTHY